MKDEEIDKVYSRLCDTFDDAMGKCSTKDVRGVAEILGLFVIGAADAVEESSSGGMPASDFLVTFSECLLRHVSQMKKGDKDKGSVVECAARVDTKKYK